MVENIKSGRFIITNLKGNREFKTFMLGHNLAIGSMFTVNYSPEYSKLVSITIRKKILSLRKEDFKKIECTRIG